MTEQLGYDGPNRKLYRFRDAHRTGLLWFINRSALNPLGYALAWEYPDVDDAGNPIDADAIERGEVDPIGWSILGDGREVFGYVESTDEQGFDRSMALLDEARRNNAEHETARREGADEPFRKVEE